jgi:trimethylamine--corrinoid protein Co-methyltransferase
MHLSVLNREECETIHHASLQILRRTGVRVFHDEALSLLRQTDALITDDNLVRFPAGLVEWAVGQAPSHITLSERDGARAAVHLAGRSVSFGPGSDCPNYLDPHDGRRRPFTVSDIVNCIHVVDALPQLDFVMSMGIPSDLGTDSPYRRQFALMIQHTTKPIVFVCDDRADCEAIVSAASACSGGIETLRLNPTILLYSEPTSPLQHSDTAIEKLLYMADQRLPVVHSPAPMMGATGPMTFAGALALGNAEILSGLVMHQLKRPQSPFVYGSGLHHMDMRTAIPVYGAPEIQLARVSVCDMGRFYGLPTWGYAGHSDSCIMDEQAAADAAYSVLVALLAAPNLVHDVGYLESGLTTSPEMIVLTAELISMMRRFMEGITVDTETLALDEIHEVGPGGNFLVRPHTRDHFREFWQPGLWERRRVREWARDGSKSLGDRLRERTVELMETHRPKPLPDAVLAEVEHILGEVEV